MDGTSASQFLYESNLYLAKTMPTMLKRPLILSAGDPGVYNDYLDMIDFVGPRVSKLDGN
jgi:DNA helicase-2/ATP-dependent DNA helicase PcrA